MRQKLANKTVELWNPPEMIEIFRVRQKGFEGIARLQ
jgi:hypothetical protein